MNVQERLEFAANEFLNSTDITYDECAKGVFTLDRIIVGTPSILSAQARGYFVPILYAYWERFFRISFNEYLRCIVLTKFNVDELRHKIAVLRIGRELADISDKHKFKQIHELCHNRTIPEVKGLLKRLLGAIESPVEFSPAYQWVRTYSNVEFSTLEENCTRFGVDVNALKANFTMKSLYASLKDLVDTRNDIAHGSEFKTLTADEWDETKSFVLKIMQVMQFELYESLKDQTKMLNPMPPENDFSI
jgi:hypothetical protein